MRCKETDRGFRMIEAPIYEGRQPTRLVWESSAIGDYPDAMKRPGSSYLYIGTEHLLNREQVKELVDRLSHWLEQGRLQLDEPRICPVTLTKAIVSAWMNGGHQAAIEAAEAQLKGLER